MLNAGSLDGASTVFIEFFDIDQRPQLGDASRISFYQTHIILVLGKEWRIVIEKRNVRVSMRGILC